MEYTAFLIFPPKSSTIFLPSNLCFTLIIFTFHKINFIDCIITFTGLNIKNTFSRMGLNLDFSPSGQV